MEMLCKIPSIKRECMLQNLQKSLLIFTIHHEVLQAGEGIKNRTNYRQQLLTHSGICSHSNYERMKISHLIFFFLAVTLIKTLPYQIPQFYMSVCFRVIFFPILKHIEAFKRIRENEGNYRKKRINKRKKRRKIKVKE
jgi:hypothetical protein